MSVRCGSDGETLRNRYKPPRTWEVVTATWIKVVEKKELITV
jgi:hypothetical protein